MVWVSKRVARCKLAGIDCRQEQSACDDLSLYVYSVRANVADSSQQMHKLYHNCYFDTHVTHSLYICAVSLTCRLASDFDMQACNIGHCSIKPSGITYESVHDSLAYHLALADLHCL